MSFRSFNEKNIGKVFKTELEGQKFLLIDNDSGQQYHTHFKVYLNKQVRLKSKKFNKFWRENGLDPINIPPSQPEIDMILIDDEGTMRAVELKLIRKYKGILRPSYYVGIDQTLAYLSFGFSQVALWLCFDGDSIPDQEIYQYNDAFSKIVLPIKQYIDTTFFKVSDSEKGPRIKGNRIWFDQKSQWGNGIGIPINGTNSTTWNSSNPFLKGFQTKEGLRLFMPEISNGVRTIYRFLQEQRAIWK